MKAGYRRLFSFFSAVLNIFVFKNSSTITVASFPGNYFFKGNRENAFRRGYLKRRMFPHFRMT